MLHLCVALLVALAPPARAPEFQVPRNDGWVTDAARFLKPAEERALEAQLEAWTQSTGHQIAVVTVPNLGGETVEAAALKVARGWGVGRAGEDDGAVLLIAKKERQLRIEVGKGLEGDLTDSVSGRILRNVITPRFKKGEFSVGIREGVAEMIAVIDGTSSGPVERVRTGKSAAAVLLLGFVPLGLFLVFAILIGRRHRRRGRRAGTAAHVPWWLWTGAGSSSGSWSSGGGGFGGGGGFSGFGGGGFSGGGASGGW